MLRAVVGGLLLVGVRQAGGHAGAPELAGFAKDGAVAQHALEARFDAELDAQALRGWMRQLAARPHHVGSPHGRGNAELIRDLFTSWGWEAELVVYDVLFPIPKVRVVELVAPTRFQATLAEVPLGPGAKAGADDEQLPTFHAYSIDGDVTGELVYVNYGVPKDYEELEKRGVSVAGKIVIARYGGSWRGIKPKVAAERGAIGCLIYSDPLDDGYGRGDVYPQGGFRPEHGAQSGSVADMPLFPGDPLTPGVAATKDAKRLALDEAPTLTKIPVLPLSYGDAQPLLAALGGPVVPSAWRGGLPLTYHIGPGPARVHLRLEFDWSLHAAYDVVARIEGAEHPDQWIVRGNHHDAWGTGATDPVSGMVAVLGEARAIGALLKTGWRPKRTLIYAAWDAEEPGLIGSTEWVEAHADELSAKAVAYVNTDSNSRGFLSAGGSHSLERFFNQVARDVTDPQTKKSVDARRRARLRLREHQRSAEDDVPLSALGSGSDYSPFLQHLGIASLNISFGGEGDYGQYHSSYDTYDHYARFMDPDFAYGVALAQVTGRVVLRLANAERLPFEFEALARTIGTYVDEVAQLADTLRTETETENGRIRSGVYEAAWDPTDGWRVPGTKEPVPHFNFAPLRNALTQLTVSAKRYTRAVTAYESEGALLGPAEAARLDRTLYESERALTRPTGLPRRPWYVHHVYAPGFYTGYGVKTLPGVREALEQRDWSEVPGQVRVAAQVLRAAAEKIGAAAEILEGAS